MVPAWKVTSEPPRADGPCERRSRRWSVPFEVDTRVIRPAAMYPNDFVFASASIFPLAWGFWRSRDGTLPEPPSSCFANSPAPACHRQLSVDGQRLDGRIAVLGQDRRELAAVFIGGAAGTLARAAAAALAASDPCAMAVADLRGRT